MLLDKVISFLFVLFVTSLNTEWPQCSALGLGLRQWPFGLLTSQSLTSANFLSENWRPLPQKSFSSSSQNLFTVAE